MQDASNLLNINAKWSLGFYCQHRVKWNLNCSKLFKCGVTQCDNVPAQEQLLVNTIFTLIEVQDAELEARVITGLTKYRNMVATGTGQIAARSTLRCPPSSLVANFKCIYTASPHSPTSRYPKLADNMYFNIIKDSK